MTKEEATKKLADIIFDAAKNGYMPYDTDDEMCAMNIAKEHIDEFYTSFPSVLEEAAEISFDEARTLTEDYVNFLAKGLRENHPRPIGPHWFCEYAKNRFIAGAKWGAEHSGSSETPKDLEEASSKFATHTANGVSVEFLHEKLAFQEGAKWQKKQMMKDGLDAIKSGQFDRIEKTIAGVFVKYGMDKQKEQMLKNAVEGYISATNEVSAVLALPKGDFKKGDKVNLLFVKKD